MIEDDSRRTFPADPNSDYQPYYPDPVPFYENSTVTPLIDGDAYFFDLYTELNQLSINRVMGLSSGSAQRIYLACWVFSQNFKLWDDKKLTELLRDHAAEGVDVRVLLWFNEGAVRIDELVWDIPFAGTCRKNLTTCQELRSYPNLDNKILLNVLDHLYGSSHMKMAFLADTTPDCKRVIAYTGGIDFAEGRKGQQRHLTSPKWHDVQARIEGDATVAPFEYFKALWNELVEKRRLEETQPGVMLGIMDPQSLYAVPETAQKFTDEDVLVPNIPAEIKNTVQSLRTVPDVTRSAWAPPTGFPLLAPGEKKLTMAAGDIFEIQLAFKCAIAAAETYIYIENSVMYSRDLLVQLKNALVANTDLKVILLTVVGTSNFSRPIPVHNYYVYEYLYKTLNENERSRVVLYKCRQYYTHAKVMIVDDKFAIIGSANIQNRSLFSDFEHSISFIDNDDYHTVKEFRQELWNEHFRTTPSQATEVAEVNPGLRVWNEQWGTAGASFTIPAHLELTAIVPPAPDFSLTYRQRVEEVGALPSP
jgi:phosphatidylserine/phosphatidylglycerophosphate/cardiolipin synthase-like enzyme